jgi:CBS domain-containing protein
MAMTVRDLMSFAPFVIDPFDTVQRAAELMRRGAVGALPVVHEGELVGVLTDRDIVLRSSARDDLPSGVPVFEVMTREVVECAPDDPVAIAAQRMIHHGVRRVVVVDGRSVVGILSVDDLAAVSQTRERAMEIIGVLTARRGVEVGAAPPV